MDILPRTTSLVAKYCEIAEICQISKLQNHTREIVNETHLCTVNHGPRGFPEINQLGHVIDALRS